MPAVTDDCAVFQVFFNNLQNNKQTDVIMGPHGSVSVAARRAGALSQLSSFKLSFISRGGPWLRKDGNRH